MTSDTFESVVYDLQQATDRLKLATTELGIARSNETAALNDVNRAQKRLDDLVQEMRQKAPTSTDWANRKVKGLPA